MRFFFNVFICISILENESDEEGARLAVYWLSRASFQGNTEATRLLQDCMDKNVGKYINIF